MTPPTRPRHARRGSNPARRAARCVPTHAAGAFCTEILRTSRRAGYPHLSGRPTLITSGKKRRWSTIRNCHKPSKDGRADRGGACDEPRADADEVGGAETGVVLGKSKSPTL